MLNKVAEKSRLVADLEGRLKAAIAAKEVSDKMVLILQKKLKLQQEKERHFTSTVGTQVTTFFGKLSEN